MFERIVVCYLKQLIYGGAKWVLIKLIPLFFFCGILILKMDVTKFLWHFTMLFILKGPHPCHRPFWNGVVFRLMPFQRCFFLIRRFVQIVWMCKLEPHLLYMHARRGVIPSPGSLWCGGEVPGKTNRPPRICLYIIHVDLLYSIAFSSLEAIYL